MRRLDLVSLGLPLGLALGLAVWLMAGGTASRATELEGAHAALAALRPPAAAASSAGGARLAPLMGAPLFALTTGPGAVREPGVRVDGLSLTKRRTAALISIDGGPAEWMQVGESRAGVTLQAVTRGGVSLETALGVKTLNLGDQSAASAPALGAAPAASPGPVATAGPDQVPPGFRGPPEPASAPRPR